MRLNINEIDNLANMSFNKMENGILKIAGINSGLKKGLVSKEDVTEDIYVLLESVRLALFTYQKDMTSKEANSCWRVIFEFRVLTGQMEYKEEKPMTRLKIRG